jgi:hypothetical protein
MLFANAHHNAQSWLGFRSEKKTFLNIDGNHSFGYRLTKKGKEQVCSKLSIALVFV